MAAYTAYDVVGKKEDISDIISNISPTDTPFQTAIGTWSIHNTLYQWQEDSLANVNTANAAIQGADAIETAPIPTVMRQNYTQILTKTLKVAETTDAVARYGRAKETAYQLGKYSKEVKRDFEAIATSAQIAAVGNNATVASTFAAFSTQVSVTNLTKTGSGATPMSEAMLLTNLTAVFNAGGDPKLLSIPPAQSINLANYASAAGRYRTIDTASDGTNAKIVNVVNLYVSPFGEVKVVLNRFQPATDHLIFDPANWKVAVLRNWTRQTLAQTGDAKKMLIVGEFGLKHANQLASGIVRMSA